MALGQLWFLRQRPAEALPIRHFPVLFRAVPDA